MSVYEYEISLWGDEKIPELEYGNVCKTLYIY